MKKSVQKSFQILPSGRQCIIVLCFLLALPGQIRSQTESLHEISLSILETSLSDDPKMEGMYYLMKAENELYFKHYKEALSYIEKTLKLDPANPRALRIGGDILSYTGDHKKAVRYYTRALAAGEEDAELSFKIGLTQLEAGKLIEAVGHFDKAILLNNEYAAAYLGRAMAKLGLDLHASAVEDYNFAIEYNPLLQEAYRGRGRCFTHLGNYATAIRDFNRAIELKPTDGWAFYYRGLTHQKAYNKSKCCADLETARQMGIKEAKLKILELCKD